VALGNISAAEKGIFTTLLKELLAKFLAWAKTVVNGRGTATIHGELTHHSVLRSTCSSNCIRRTLARGLSSTGLSMRSYTCSCTSPSSAGYHRRANSASFLDVTISGVKRASVRKSTLRIPFGVQLYSCCVLVMGVTTD
jgi:hypothetical protein